MSDGLSSRLHQSLVYEQQIAQSAHVRYYAGEIAGQFTVQVTAAPGHNLEQVEAAVDAELARVHREPPTDEEITRVKNRIEASPLPATGPGGAVSAAGPISSTTTTSWAATRL